MKPENVLIASNGHIKLTDFGISKQGIFSSSDYADERLTYSVVGTIEYLAPEIVKKQGHDNKADFWSLGILLYELYTGHTPFDGAENQFAVMKKTIDDNQKIDAGNHLKNADEDLKDLILNCLLQREPERRLAVNELKNHPFFDTINWEEASQLGLEPPIIPVIESSDDMRNIDKRFLRDSVPIDMVSDETESLAAGGPKIRQSQFIDFDYNNGDLKSELSAIPEDAPTV